jgi:hypothetical protein
MNPLVVAAWQTAARLGWLASSAAEITCSAWRGWCTASCGVRVLWLI